MFCFAKQKVKRRVNRRERPSHRKPHDEKGACTGQLWDLGKEVVHVVGGVREWLPGGGGIELDIVGGRADYVVVGGRPLQAKAKLGMSELS